MNEGWLGGEYFILFTPAESEDVSSKYAMETFLPGFTVVGLRDWDDFLVRDASGQGFSIPTVPVDPKHMQSVVLPEHSAKLEMDGRIAGKIKWYLKPLVFGGDASEANANWVTHEQHQQLVAFWNKQYRAIKGMLA
jgi:hypothetical protein